MDSQGHVGSPPTTMSLGPDVSKYRVYMAWPAVVPWVSTDILEPEVQSGVGSMPDRELRIEVNPKLSSD